MPLQGVSNLINNLASLASRRYAIIIGIILLLAIIAMSCYWYCNGNTEQFNGEEEASQVPQVQSSKAIEDDTDEIVLYYATWCGYSKIFLPEWEKFEEYAKNNLPNLKVTKLRCEGGNEPICMQKGVEGYPTVIMYLKDGREVPFQGDRTSEKLIEFTAEHL